MAEPWGGIVPNVPVDQHDAAAEFAAGVAGPDAPPAVPPPGPPSEQVAQLLTQQDMLGALERFEQLIALTQTPAQLQPITFNGEVEPKRLIFADEHGPDALSYGIINPTEAKVYVGFGGEQPAPNNHAFVVGAQMAIVMPIAVHQVNVGIDPVDLGANQATIFRLRFRTVQPFFMGLL